MSQTQKPLLLKDFLELDPHSDYSNSFSPFPRKPQPPTVRFLLEADRGRSAASFRRSASISGGGAFSKLINAVKKFPLSSSPRPSEEGLLMRSISRKLNKRFWKRKDKEGRRVTTVKDIVRLDSFELYGERRSLCFPSPVVSSCSSCSDDGEEGSESFVSSSSSGELDCFPCEKSHKSPSQNQSPLLSSSMEGEHQGVEYKGCVSEEEKEQLSPVSIMDFPCQYEDDEGEDEEARTFGFERNLANIEIMAAKFKIEKFDGSNFSLWKLKIKAILRKDNCLAVIGARPDNITDDKKWNEMDENAIANLHLAFADMVLSSMEEKKTANET